MFLYFFSIFFILYVILLGVLLYDVHVKQKINKDVQRLIF